MDYPLDGLYPVDSPYGQGRTSNMRSQMSNDLRMGSTSHGAYVPETYGFRDRTMAAFDGYLGEFAAQEHATLAIDPGLQSSGEQTGPKKRKIRRIDE